MGDVIDTHPAIEAIYAQVVAWNRGDLDGYMAHVHPEVTYIRPGSLLRGRAALHDSYRASTGAMGQLSVEVLDICASPDQASLVLSWALAGAQSGCALVVYVATAEGWLLRHDATMVDQSV
ncbi:MAG: ketosteroid isomerase-like protein [Myxococcota bacterium]|jgi:ketosteroid isomerase-like protein